MEQWLIDFIKDSPGYGVILTIVIMGLKAIERMADKWAKQLKEISDQQVAMSDKWLESIKEIREKCHEAHEKVSTMYHDQSCKVLEAWTKLNVHIEHLARVVEAKK